MFNSSFNKKVYFCFFFFSALLTLLVVSYIASNELVFIFIALFIFKYIFIFLLFLIRNKKVDVREPIFILAIIDAVFFGFAFFVMHLFFPKAGVFVRDFSQLENFVFSTIVNTVGWISFSSGYALCSSHKNLILVLTGKRFLSRLRCSLAIGEGYPKKNYRKTEQIVVAALILSILLNLALFVAKGGSLRDYGSLPPSLAQPVYVVEQSLSLVVALATVVAAKMSNQGRTNHGRSKLLLLIVLLSFVSMKLAISIAKEDIGTPIVIAVYSWFLATKQFPLKLFLSLTGFYLVFAPLNAAVRNNVEVLERGKIQLVDYLDAGYSLFFSESGRESLESAYGVTIERLELAGISGSLIDRVRDGVIPTTDGASFLGFFNAFIPRFIFPLKPEVADLYHPNYLARQIGALPSTDTGTSIAFGIPAELYLNFKLPAVIFGMLFLGYLLKVTYDLFAQNQILSDLSIVTLSLPLFRFYFAYTNALFGLTTFVPIVIFTILLMSIFARFLPLAYAEGITQPREVWTK